MRLFELAKKLNMNGKDLLQVVQDAGFEVHNSLATIGNDIVAWVENQPPETFEVEKPGGRGKVKVATAPVKKQEEEPAAPVAAQPTKKVAAPVVEKTDAAPQPAVSEPEKTEDAPQKARKQKIRKPLRGKEEEPEVAPVVELPPVEAPVVEQEEDQVETKVAEKPTRKEAAAEKPRAEAKDKPKKTERKPDRHEEKKEEKKPGRKPAAENLPDFDLDEMEDDTPIVFGKPADSRDPAIGDQESLLIVSEEEERKPAGHKHKRADFRSANVNFELPAGFKEMDAKFIAKGGGRSRRTGGRRSGFRSGGRNRRSSGKVLHERDPNAVYTVSSGMTIRDLSAAMGIKLSDIVSYFMKNGQMVAVNDILSEDDVALLSTEFGVNIEWKLTQNLEDELESSVVEQEESSLEEDLVMRPPVITFLGHVDHGKTSLLDKIRHTRVAAGEAGGITQHIGAYTVEKNGHEITFLDTPGHEAFTAMRARGAALTDIAVLVVAADDGVMPQTEEAASHAKNAGVPVVVAINKCDIAGANPDRVRQELSTRLGLLPEEWGGNVGMVDVSALTGDGIETLLERILLESEMLELKADPNRPATGHMLEAKVSESRGVVATMLVIDGTLRRGDILLCSTGYGKVKLMYDENGRTIEEAGPGKPVRIVGLSNVPEVGDKVYVLDDIVKARNIAEQRERATRNAALSRRAHVTLENLQAHLAESETRELKVILKADVMGSLEVVEKTLRELSKDEQVRINVIHAAVGGINHADVILADASDAIIVGFHVVADQNARLQASSHSIQIKIYHIIYRLIEDMKAALEGMLPPEEREVAQGRVEIREVFRASRVGNIAGCYVTDGFINRHSKIRIIRDNIVIYDGKLDSLKRFKDDAREVKTGFECGLKIANYDDIKVGDMLEAYTIEEVARKLES
jgi:translation initiation factor IF-2